MDYAIDYNEHMLNYYPEIIKGIREFQALIKSQSLEVEQMHKELTQMLANAYVTTADEATLVKWEKLLEITPDEQGEYDLQTWLSDRRDTILARLYKVEKLNTKSIADIVKIFTGGETESYFKDGIIHVTIYPGKENKMYKFDTVERELRKKIPAHLAFEVERNYYAWLQINESFPTWGSINDTFTNWRAVLYQF